MMDLFGKQPLPTGFERFWAVYPRKDDRAVAAKAYTRALRKVTNASLLAAAVIYAELNRDKEKKYIKLAATWLNGECWNNQAEPAVVRVMSNKYKVLTADPIPDPAMQERVGSLLRSLASHLRQGSRERAYVARREAKEREDRRLERMAGLGGMNLRQRPAPAQWRPSQELIELVRRQTVME